MKITFTKGKFGSKKAENHSDVFSSEIDLPKDTTWGEVIPLLKSCNFFDKGDYAWVLYDNIEQEILCYYSICDRVFFFHSVENGLVGNAEGEPYQIVTHAVIAEKPLYFIRQSRTQRARYLFEGYGCSDYMMWHECVDGQFDLCDVSKEEHDRWQKEFEKKKTRRNMQREE